MKKIVVYNSKTGFAKRYAEWAAEELGLSAVPYKSFDQSAAYDADLVVFISRIQAGKIEQLAGIKKLLGSTAPERLVVAAVGAAPMTAEETINKYWADNFSEEEMTKVPHFYMQGGLDYEKMGFGERSILKVVTKVLKNKKDKTDEDAVFEQTLGSSFDNSSRDFIKPLVEFVNGT